MRENTARKPTAQELMIVKKYYIDTGQDEETAHNILNNSWFVAFDSNTADSAPFAGILLVAIYGMVEFYEVFHIEQKKITRVVFYSLTLDQSIHLTSVINTALTNYLQTLGYIKKKKYNRSRK